MSLIFILEKVFHGQQVFLTLPLNMELSIKKAHGSPVAKKKLDREKKMPLHLLNQIRSLPQGSKNRLEKSFSLIRSSSLKLQLRPKQRLLKKKPLQKAVQMKKQQSCFS